MDQYVATIGTFDGVHKGHKYLINKIKKTAYNEGLKSCIITFNQPPILVVRPDKAPPSISTLDEKIRKINEIGVDKIEVLQFDLDMAKLTAKEFIEEILSKQLHVKHLIIGYDHRFGHNRSEGFEEYKAYGEAIGMKVDVFTEFVLGNDEVSSTTIRKYLEDGKLSLANEMLGYHYNITGEVVNGFRNGRLLGYPTANIKPNDPHKLIPKEGVYAVRVYIAGDVFKGMLYIGRRPTFNNGPDISIEVNIFDLNKDLYGQEISLEFIAYTRGDIKFKNIEELQNELENDAEICKRILSE